MLVSCHFSSGEGAQAILNGDTIHDLLHKIVVDQRDAHYDLLLKLIPHGESEIVVWRFSCLIIR